MSVRHLEKFPIVWSGEMEHEGVPVTLKATYLWGAMETAATRLPKSAFVNVESFRIGKDANLCQASALFQKKDSCVLTCVPVDSELKTCPLEEKTFKKVVKKLMRGGAHGFEVLGVDDCRVHMYLRTRKVRSLVAQLAPDAYHMYCERNYMIMVVTV